MADADVKDEAPKQLGRIALKRRPMAAVLRPRDPVARHAQLLALSEKHGVPALDLDQVCLKTEDLANVPRDLAQHHILIPVLARPDRLFVAMRDPSHRDVIQEVEFVSGKHVYAYAAPAEDIAEAIEKAYLARERGEAFFIGPSCPPETLRRAGLLPQPEEDRVQPCMPPAMDLTQNEEPPSRVEIVLPAEPDPNADPGPPVTVSAIPPRLSSLPPALRGRGTDPGAEGEVLSAVETAFEDLFSEVSTVGPLPTDPLELERGDRSPTLLVVDADAESRGELARILSDAGYGVRTADSGRAALAIIRERAPDLLLIAAVLPDVHGIEIARRLRGSERYGGMPVVMIGAVDRGWRAAEDLKEGHDVDACVEKPLDKTDVERKVAQALLAALPSERGNEQLAQRAEEALAEGMQAYRGGEISSAIQHLERGIAIDPLAYRLHLHLGLVLAQQGQIYDAIRALERAVEIKPQHFAGVKNLAILYFQAGFRNRAVELWQRGLELAPDPETRAAIEEHLAALLSQEGLS